MKYCVGEEVIYFIFIFTIYFIIKINKDFSFIAKGA